MTRLTHVVILTPHTDRFFEKKNNVKNITPTKEAL